MKFFWQIIGVCVIAYILTLAIGFAVHCGLLLVEKITNKKLR